jgi:type IV pilus assembly protein PilQ
LIATTEYVDVPLRLAVTPQITDAGTVILNVVAENSSAAIVSGGAAPAINNQTMTTQVVVPDGGTTVVGGVLFDDERESQDRTPGLSNIPLLGNLFKRKKVDKNTNEILFFITPRITRMDYNGNPVVGSSLAKESKTTTIMQPVPLGNPASNSETRPNQSQTPGVPVTSLIQPEVNPNQEKKP